MEEKRIFFVRAKLLQRLSFCSVFLIIWIKRYFFILLTLKRIRVLLDAIVGMTEQNAGIQQASTERKAG